MTDDGRRRRRTMATTNDGDDERRRRRTTVKKSRALILPKILNFRKIARFWKTAKIWFFSKVRPFDERVKWRMTDDGDDGRWRRRTTGTTNDCDDGRRWKNLMHSFCQKSWILEKLRVFEKQRKFDFFQRSVPLTKEWNDGWRTTATTDDGDDERRRRRRRRKNLVHSFCQKSWILEKLRVFEKQRKFDFFQRSVPLTKEWNDGRRRRRTTATMATTNDGDDERRRRRTTVKKSRALILPKILNFRKIASFWKTAKIWFFSKVRPFDERVKWRTTATTDDGDDGWQRRLTMATTNDGDDGRRWKNLMHSFCQKSWILGKLPVFEKQQKFDFFQRSVPLTKEWNDGWRTTATMDDGDDERRERRTTATTDDGEKISCTHFAKNLEF